MRQILLVVSLLCLTACEKTVVDQSIRFALQQAPLTLDPRLATDANSERINRLIYRSLVEFNEKSQPISGIARWQKLNATHYRFTLLEEGRFFHNGERLTAEDVAACYRYILDNANASPHRSNLSNIKSIKVIDDNVIDFILHKRDTLFVNRMVIGIPQNSNKFQTVGSGAFKVIDNASLRNLELQRLSDEQSLVFVEVTDPTVRALKMMNGEIDIMQNDLPTEIIVFLKQQEQLKVEQADGTSFSYIGFNSNDSIVGDLLVRQAIAYAIDREAIIRYLRGGQARIAESLLSPQHWAGHNNLNTITYNPEQARALLSSAGYSLTNRPKITYKTSTDPLRLRIATAIQQQLAKVGIDVVIRSYDWGTFFGDIKSGNFQMYSLSWVGIRSPDIFEYVFHSKSIPPKGANRGRFISEKMDALIDAAVTVTDRDEMAGYYYQIQELLHAQMPYVPLWYEGNVAIMNRSINNYRLSDDGNFDGLISTTKY